MLKSTIKVAMLAIISAVSTLPAIAQDDLLANKPIYTLGEPKTWDNGELSYSFVVDDLAKLVAVPTNTANVYLYPENPASQSEAYREVGIQGFYIDMGTSQSVGIVGTTWEGAAANAVAIYLTDQEPTINILSSTPTFSATGLGQYTSKNFILPEGAKGRYLVFQPTDATNYGWGVKIRSISATAPTNEILTSFTVSPTFVTKGSTTPVTYTILNQFGLDMTADITIEGGSLDENNVLTIDDDYATFTASADGVEMQSKVYAVDAPAIPQASNIMVPVYTNYPEGYSFEGIDFNGLAGFIEAYNGGAKNLGRLRWSNNEVAAAFGNTRCVFFYNQAESIMGGWDKDINPTEKGYGYLHLDIFAARDLTGNVVFENTVQIGNNHAITLEEGVWNEIDIPLVGETVLHTMSVRFDAENAGDIILANIYFAPQLAEGDDEAPVLGEVTVDPLAFGATLNMTATDQSSVIYYTIKVGDNQYICNGKSGETVSYTIPGLSPETDYTASITVSDGINSSEPTAVSFRTLAIPTAPDPTHPEADVTAVFSAYYGVTALPTYDNWGSAGYAAPLTIGDKTVLSLNNYMGQWGGLINFGVNAAGVGATHLHIDILGSSVDGQLTIYPVWTDEAGISLQAEGTHFETPIKANEWNSIDYNLEDDFDYHSGTVFQLALNGSTIPNFAVDNFYFYSNGDSTAVKEAIIEKAVEPDMVFDMQGRMVAKGANACQNLPAGIYIIKGKKFIKK